MVNSIYKETFDRVKKVMVIFSKNHPEFDKETNHLFTHNFNVLSIEAGKQKTNFGACSYQKNYFGFNHKAIYGSKITYNKRLLEECEKDQLLNTIVHEIFHSCAENLNLEHQGHRGFWKEMAEIYNSLFPEDIPIKRTGSWEQSIETSFEDYKYMVYCEDSCGFNKKYKRKGKVLKNLKNYRCPKCGAPLYAIELR